MKLSKDELSKHIQLYLNDLSDYGENDEHELAESILEPFRNTIHESEQDIHSALMEASKESPEHKQSIIEFINYIKSI